MIKRHEGFEHYVTLAVAGDIAFKFTVHEANHVTQFLAAVGIIALVLVAADVVRARLGRTKPDATDAS